MSSCSNISQSTYSSSDPETPNSTSKSQSQNFDQSLNNEDSTDQPIKHSQKELHQKRIQSLRKELEYLKATEWKFEYDKGFVQ